MLQGLQTIGGPLQLSNGIQESGNDQSENFQYDGKMKLSLGRFWVANNMEDIR